MRAYVASLIAVFMALAIGILLGTVIQEKSPLVDQINDQIKSLQGEFASVREENRALEGELQGVRQMGESILPVLTEGRLLGKQVALVKTGRVSNKVTATLSGALHEAGAEVSELTILKYGINADLEKALRRYANSSDLADQTSDGGVTTDTSVEDKATEDAQGKSESETTPVPVTIDDEYLAGILASALVSPLSSPSISDLTKIGILKAETPSGAEIDAVIFVVDPSGDAGVVDSFLVPFSVALNSVGIVAVIAESGQTTESIMAPFAASGTSTVDNIDDATGSISAVYALSGSVGSFGKKDGAESLLPQLSQ